MKLLLGFFVMTIIISTVWGWTAIELTDNSKEHPGHCYSTKENVGAMEKGETKTLKGECVRAICSDSTDIEYAGCGTIDAKCISKGDLTKDYPKCCPQIIECS